MRRLPAFLILGLALSAAAQDFGAGGEALLHLPRLAPPAFSLEAPPKPRAQTLTRVCGEEAWARLLQRARKDPTRTQQLQLNGAAYKVYIVSTQAAVRGQECPEGAHPENSLFVASPAAGKGPDLYPVRISAVCRDASGVRDSFSLVADIKGNILGASIYNGSLGITTHPLSEPAQTDGEASSLGAFLSRLVELFLEAH